MIRFEEDTESTFIKKEVLTMSENINKIKRIPKEEAVEQIFEKILSSPVACEKLSDTFYDHITWTILRLMKIQRDLQIYFFPLIKTVT